MVLTVERSSTLRVFRLCLLRCGLNLLDLFCTALDIFSRLDEGRLGLGLLLACLGQVPTRLVQLGRCTLDEVFACLAALACRDQLVVEFVDLLDAAGQRDTCFLQRALGLGDGQSAFFQLCFTSRKLSQARFGVTGEALKFRLQRFQFLTECEESVTTEAQFDVFQFCRQGLETTSSSDLTPEIVNLALHLDDDVFQAGQVCFGRF